MEDLRARRAFLRMLGTGAISAWAISSGVSLPVCAGTPAKKRLTKTIPSSGKSLPVIGMGTWRTFNVGDDPQLLAARTQVVNAFFEHGGGLIDSSPMYGSAPETIGYALRQLGVPKTLFAAEKVWSPAGGDAREQVTNLAGRWGIDRFDLVQVHNLEDWREQLAVLRALKASGDIRYIGITTSHGRRHELFEQVMHREEVDFAQLTYNITHREVEARLLPLAREKGIAVIANRPYDGGGLIKELKRGRKVPAWAQQECGCRTWADFLLKFIVSHPAVNCAIPATTRVAHMNENMSAGSAPLPDGKTRQRMAAYIARL